MTWFSAGASALISTGAGYIGAMGQKSAGIANANSASRAEGEAIASERLNQTVRNSYSTALSQMQLSMRKRQLSQQGADIGAATLAARGDAALGIAATSSIGQTTNAIVSDINMKSEQAMSQTAEQYANDAENYNRELVMMAINSDQSAPNVRANEYNGPSDMALLGGSLLQGAASFAGNYAMRKMTLGLGKTPNQL